MEGYNNLSQTNFNPNQIAGMTSKVTQFVVIMDRSGSVDSFAASMNKAMEELFMQNLKNCHVSHQIMIKCVLFNNDVVHKSGFMPIANLQDDYLNTGICDGGTALYKAVFEAMEDVIEYRTALEDTGVIVNTSIFIVSDGGNNTQTQYGQKVKDLITDLRTKKEWSRSFTITFMGIGNRAVFEDACAVMGLDKKVLVSVTDSPEVIRDTIGIVSKSVSSSGGIPPVSF